MITNRSKRTLFVIIVVIAAGVFLFLRKGSEQTKLLSRIVKVSREDILLTVNTTGVVEPQNRLEVKPSIGGRIEQILVEEGDRVEEGDILAWMSSTERAALVDAAISQGDEVLAYWQDVYKQTSIVSPIQGEVIVRLVEPGQTVMNSDVVLVLSDRLIIKAQFDETDIGKVKKGQKALITLDAYPNVQINGLVDHIAYESEIVNNVTIYEVDIVPEQVPEILRSGMSVTVEVIEKFNENTIIVPSEAVRYNGQRAFVLVEEKPGHVVEYDVKTGLINNKSTEIISGIKVDDSIVVTSVDAILERKKTGANPFMPTRKKK